MLIKPLGVGYVGSTGVSKQLNDIDTWLYTLARSGILTETCEGP